MYGRGRRRPRFSLLQLDYNESFFIDLGCILDVEEPAGQKLGLRGARRLKGRLKVGSWSLTFDPEDPETPLLRLPMREMPQPADAWDGDPDGGEGEKDDEVVDLDKLLAFLRDLEIRGNLQVQRPSAVDGLTQLLSQYDGGGDGVKKMQMREWRVFLQDVATDPVDHTTSSVAKLAREVHNLHATARAERRRILAMHEQLRSLIKAKAVRRRSAS